MKHFCIILILLSVFSCENLNDSTSISPEIQLEKSVVSLPILQAIIDYKASSDFIAMGSYWKAKIDWSSASLSENFNGRADILKFRYTDDVDTRITRLTAMKNRSTGMWTSIIDRVITDNGVTIDENITNFTGKIITYTPISTSFEILLQYQNNQLQGQYYDTPLDYDPLGCSGTYYYNCYREKIIAMNVVERVACLASLPFCNAGIAYGCMCECLGWGGC